MQPALYWFRDPRGNVGDDLNPWLWSRLLPEIPAADLQARADATRTHGRPLRTDQLQSASPLLLGIGTLLNHRLPAAPGYWVFGSGAGYGQLPRVDQHWRVYAVRGPHSAARLGLAPELAISDPAYLLRQCWSPPVTARRGSRVCFMPHVDTAHHGDWQRVCQLAGVDYLSPSQSPEAVFTALADCRLLLSEAMHGAIIADALRIPWQPLRCESDFAIDKWQDWLASIKLTADFPELPPVWHGDLRLPLPQLLRQRSKRLIHRLGIRPGNWTAPPPPASRQSDFERSAERLSELSQRDGWLVDDRQLSRIEEQLLAALERLRTDWQRSDGD